MSQPSYAMFAIDKSFVVIVAMKIDTDTMHRSQYDMQSSLKRQHFSLFHKHWLPRGCPDNFAQQQCWKSWAIYRKRVDSMYILDKKGAVIKCHVDETKLYRSRINCFSCRIIVASHINIFSTFSLLIAIRYCR